ncbi:MAG: DUF4430 domain-containing protein [Pirellulaceae bacterium]|nr:DUF4430 domain-containing protein [Pirellulaceae bacterium]
MNRSAWAASRLMLLVVVAACATSFELTAAEPEKTVALTIDYGDGVQKVFRKLAWKDGQTVFATLQLAAEHPRGIKIAHRGQGATLLVTAIDDLKNEGRGNNWTYEVNGKLADRGCGVWELAAGDAVLWRFGEYR